MKTKGISREGFRRYFENKITNPIDSPKIERVSRIARETRRVFVTPWEIRNLPFSFTGGGGTFSTSGYRIDIFRPSRQYRISIGKIHGSAHGTPPVGQTSLILKMFDSTTLPLGTFSSGQNQDKEIAEWQSYAPAAGFDPVNIDHDWFPDGLLMTSGMSVAFLLYPGGFVAGEADNLVLSCWYRYENWS